MPKRSAAPPRSLNSRQLAKQLGVSQSTISRAFSNHASIKPETRERVVAAALAMGYRPNVIARSLSMRSSKIVGIVMGNLTNPFYPIVLEKLIQDFEARGLQAMLFAVGPGEDVDSKTPQLHQYMVDAIVVTSANISSHVAEEWANLGRPAVLFNRAVRGASVKTITCDNRAGAVSLAQFLFAQGYRRPAFVGGASNTSTNQQRKQAFQSWLKKAGIPEVMTIDAGAYSYEAGYAAALQVWERRPDAIFFANDLMAIGGIDALRNRLGLKIPDDVAVVGFDDIPMAGWPTYNLTTVAQPVGLMVQATGAYIENVLGGAELEFNSERIRGELILRGTTRR